MDARRLREIEAEMRHAKERYDLYRARALSGRETEPAELRERERVYHSALERYRHARRQGAAG